MSHCQTGGVKKQVHDEEQEASALPSPQLPTLGLAGKGFQMPLDICCGVQKAREGAIEGTGSLVDVEWQSVT